MPSMNALVKQGRTLAVRTVPVPGLGDADVRIRVRMAGLCRTDVQVARGVLGRQDPIIPGHEFAGEVDAVGPGVNSLREGDRVCVLPVMGCGACPLCASGDEINCPRRTMLGLDRDGAFAEFITVPARYAFAVPAQLPWQAAAYAEPVAATLGVIRAGLRAGQRGLVLGRNRFAVLVERLLGVYAIDVTLYDPQRGDPVPPEDAFDFVIETGLAEDTLAQMTRAARPGGTLVLKSRQPGAVRFEVLPALLKQLTIRAVNYGCFRQAVSVLVEGRLDLTGLLGPVLPLTRAAEVLLGECDESAKLFFDPQADHVWNRR